MYNYKMYTDGEEQCANILGLSGSFRLFVFVQLSGWPDCKFALAGSVDSGACSIFIRGTFAPPLVSEGGDAGGSICVPVAVELVFFSFAVSGSHVFSFRDITK